MTTSAPFIYVIDYSDKWIKDPDTAKLFGDMPPDVLHIGKSVPVLHNWGAVPLMAGENQYTGGPKHTLNREAIRLLTPAELEQRIADITAGVERLHEAGIRLVMPYICFYSIAGDHETREGLWAFYDHWDDYARRLGPKPPTGPTDWLRRNAEGKRIESGYGLTPSYFAPLHRYAVCPNNPSWDQFSVAIVKLIAECGYDGVFVDNSTMGGDRCKHCEAAFPKWVREHFDEATLKRACGEDFGEIDLGNRKLSPIIARWNTALIRDRLAMLREAGAEVKPGFQVFPNVGNFQRAIPLGDGCDLLMFESVLPPGCLIEGEPPDDPEALIHVAPSATPAAGTMPYRGMHSDVFSEVTADIHYPRACPPGQATEITVNVLTVGASNRDADCLEALTVRLTHLESGESEDILLGPLPGVGDPNQVPGAKRPPVELKGSWTPQRAGAYAIDIRYKYTDAEHLDAANHTPVADRLGLTSVYRVNLGGLACTYNSRCKTIGLSYMHTKKGWEAVQELSIAEGAAAGGRYAVNSRGETQEKYWRFFHEHGDVAAGLVPYGHVTLLYSYWGGNPGAVGRDAARTIAENLSARHVLYRGLVDRDLEAADLAPAKGKTLIMVCRHYDLSDAQIRALSQFLANGGKLLLEHADTRINFTPLRDVLGPSAELAGAWDWEKPPDLGPALCPSEGRLRGVRFTAFIDPAPKPRRLVLHALNYNVTAFDANPGVVTPATDLTLRVPVPADWARVRATTFNPDAEPPQELTCQVAEGVATITLPELRIYQMIELAVH